MVQYCRGGGQRKMWKKRTVREREGKWWFSAHLSHLQAILSKMLTYHVLRPTHSSTLSGTKE